MAKIELNLNDKYNIQPIKGENYNDCDFVFGEYRLTAIEYDEYFQIFGKTEWWDSKGFKITRINNGVKDGSN